jgi:hypothetical protein
MPQLIGIILLIGFAMFAFQVAILLLLLAGLIFRTKETVGLIAILAIIAGFTAQPLIATGVVIVLIAISLYFKNKEKKAGQINETTPQLINDTDQE